MTVLAALALLVFSATTLAGASGSVLPNVEPMKLCNARPTMGERPATVSVVVCTADRKAKLKALLASLADLAVPPACSAELILVNNMPAIDIATVVGEVASNIPMSIKLVSEAAPGLAGARNRGLSQSRGEIIAFTDDDCVVDRDWLVRIWGCFTNDSDLMCMGGRVELFDSSDQPITVLQRTSPGHLSSSDQVFGFLHGCNMAFRRELFDRIGGFDPDFGIGSPVNSGDDTEFLYRGQQAGAKIRYEPKALVRHHHGRKTWSEMRRTLVRYHQANGAILAKHAGRGDGNARAMLKGVTTAPLTSLSRRPFSLIESLRACYRVAVWGFGAVRYKMFVAGGSTG